MLGTDLGLAVGDILETPDSELHAPALCDIEFTSGLRRLVRSADVPLDRAWDAIEDYLALPVNKHGHELLVARVFELRDNFAATDATYVGLCERLDADLVTCDGRLTRGVQRLLPLNVIGVTG